MSGEKRRSGSGRPKGSKDKTQRKARSAAAQEFEKEVLVLAAVAGVMLSNLTCFKVVAQLTAFCGDDASKWNAKKPAIDAVKASPLWDSWSKAGLNEQQLVQFVHRLKTKRMGGKEIGGPKAVEMPTMSAIPPVSLQMLMCSCSHDVAVDATSGCSAADGFPPGDADHESSSHVQSAGAHVKEAACILVRVLMAERLVKIIGDGGWTPPPVS